MTTRTNKRKVLTVAGLLAVGATALLVPWRAQQERTASSKAPGIAPGSQAQAPAPVASGPSHGVHQCNFSADQTLSYAINITGSSTLPAAMLGQSPSAAPVKLPSSTSLSLDLKALGATSSGSTVLLARYRDVKSTLLSDVDNMRTPFLLRVSDSCAITGFARRAGTAKASARTQQAIAHELMWTWPAHDGDEVQGENGYGPYLARYTVQPASQTVKREIMSYDAFWEEEHGGPQRLDVIPRSSETSVALDAGPWFKALHGREILAGKTTSFDTKLSVARTDFAAKAFDGVPQDEASYQWEDLLPQEFKLRAPRPVTGADLQARAAVRHYTARQSVDRFMQRFDDKVPFHETWPELTTYLEARPDQTDGVLDELKRGTVSQDAAPALYVALGRARTAESLAVLYDVMHSEASPLPERIRAAFAMVDRDDVGVDLAREMAAHADGIDDRSSKVRRLFGREIALATGALSGLHQDDDEMRQVVMDMAKKILAKSKDPILVRPAFGALANMGDISALPIAEQAFASDDAGMREVAAIVIRRMSPRDTSDVVARWLARETDWNVKRAIYTTVSRQMADIQLPASPALITQAATDLRADPGNITRKAIIRILGRSIRVSPEARAALVERLPLEIKKRDSSQYGVIAKFLAPEETREALRNAL